MVETFDVSAYGPNWGRQRKHVVQESGVSLERALEIVLSSLRAGLVSAHVSRAEGVQYGYISAYPEHLKRLEAQDFGETLDTLHGQFLPLERA